MTPYIIHLHESHQKGEGFLVWHLCHINGLDKQDISLTFNNKTAATKGRPWQYPTKESYLSKRTVRCQMGMVARMYLQRICLEDIEQIFLPYPMAICEEGMVWECPSINLRHVPKTTISQDTCLPRSRVIDFSCELVSLRSLM